jgi:hypothetical protein
MELVGRGMACAFGLWVIQAMIHGGEIVWFARLTTDGISVKCCLQVATAGNSTSPDTGGSI